MCSDEFFLKHALRSCPASLEQTPANIATTISDPSYELTKTASLAISPALSLQTENTDLQQTLS